MPLRHACWRPCLLWGVAPTYSSNNQHKVGASSRRIWKSWPNLLDCGLVVPQSHYVQFAVVVTPKCLQTIDDNCRLRDESFSNRSVLYFNHFQSISFISISCLPDTVRFFWNSDNRHVMTRLDDKMGQFNLEKKIRFIHFWIFGLVEPFASWGA